MQIKKIVNTVLSQFVEAPLLPKISKPMGFTTISTLDYAKIICGDCIHIKELFVFSGIGAEQSVVGIGCKVSIGNYSAFFPMNRKELLNFLKKENVVRHRRVNKDKLIELLKYYSGTNVLDDW